MTFPILRPLIGFDKVEIERVSRRVGLWREKHVGCCTVTPRKPATGARKEVLDELYEKLKIATVVENEFTKRLEIQVKSEHDLDRLYLQFLKQILP